MGIGLIRVSHAVTTGMAARGRGHIVNLGSIAGIGAYPAASTAPANMRCMAFK